MRRLLFPAVLSLLFIFTGIRAFAIDDMHTVSMQLEQPVDGMVYGVYEDPSCTILYKDEKNQDAKLISNQKGSAEVKISSSVYYIHQIDSAAGYYLDPMTYTEKDSLQCINVYPISIHFSVEEIMDAHLQILDAFSHEVLADWREGNTALYNEEPYPFSIKKSYLLHAADHEEMAYWPDIFFTVSEYGKDTISYEMKKKAYGKLNIRDQYEGNGNALFALYADEACTVPAEDIFEKETVGTVKNAETLSLLLNKGTYYLKQMDIQSTCYLDPTVQKIEIEEQEETLSEWSNPSVTAFFSMQNADTSNQLPGELQLKNDEKTFSVPLSQEVVLERDHTYTLIDAGHPDGYYKGEDITFMIPSYEEGRIEKIMSCIPFAVTVHYLDKETDQRITGGSFRVINLENQSEIYSFDINEEQSLKHLKNGQSYQIQQTETMNGYLSISDTDFSISESIEDPASQDIHIDLYSTPYVTMNINVIGVDPSAVSDTEISFFSGTDTAKDIDGNDVKGFLNSEGQTSFHLLNGTYTWKITAVPKGYYQDNAVHEVNVLHSKDSVQSLQTSLVHADIAIEIKQPDGTLIDNTIVELYSNGSKAGEFSTDENTSLLQKNVIDILPGNTYGIEIKNAPGLYTYVHERKEIALPDALIEDEMKIEFILEPYLSINAIEGNENKMTEGSQYSLYTDSSCSKKAEDINGRIAVGITNEDGKISWNVREGTYWLKQDQSSANTYRNTAIVKVIADSSASWQIDEHFTSIPVTLSVTLEDEANGKRLAGRYQILSEEGEVLYTWNAGLVQPIQENWLRINTTYYLHEIEAPVGYQTKENDIAYTVSEEGEKDEIIISYQHESKKALSSLKNSDTGLLSSISWSVPFLGALIILLGIVLVKVFKEMKRTENEH